ncbi:MAG TPA: hypothetical protein VKD91_00820 [Pyrinomonadaceae bacterium]|nr:hypothetical protein [Pyrinomonadaceae bacterium]
MPFTAMPMTFRQAPKFMTQVIATCVISICALAQQPKGPLLPAPPPMRFVSRADRSQLDAARDPKNRLRASVKLAEDRLTHAENLTNQKSYDEASAEIGCYLGLIGDLRAYIGTMEHDKGSTRDLYRHMEMAIRPHIPRLAVMRRSTPANYSIHIKDAEDYIKDTRAEALDSFYGHSVLREPPPDKTTEPPKPSPDAPKRP